jgi:hypothetical membrane protein
MTTNLSAHAAPAVPAFDRRAAVTRSLLGYGVVAGPFYVAVGVIQGLVRDGFDFSRHPLSVLANGPGGWVQSANFALTGLMVVAAAIGIARVLGPGSRGTSWLLGAYGAGMIAASVLRADPVDGFPVGTPPGPPTTMTTMGMLHFVVATLGFVALGISCLVAARALARRGERSFSRWSMASGLVVFVTFFGGAALSTRPIGIAGIWIAVLVGWAWLAALSMHLYRKSPSPNCDPSASS